MTLVMWKWCPPTGKDLAKITDDQPLTLRYTPWRTSRNPSSKEINKAAFSEWYQKMLETIRATKKVPKGFFDAYS